MFPKEIWFRLDNHMKEWKLFVTFDNNSTDWWCVQTWKKRPTTATVEKTKELILRGIKVYTRFILKPDLSHLIIKDVF